MSYQPPYTITSTILSLVADISERIGFLSALESASRTLHLRRINRIRTIHGSLAIEGNTLSEEQITAILEGKLVLAPLREIQEVRNAIKAYDLFEQWQPALEKDLLAAHEILMTGLLDAPGRFRSGGVGVMAGDKVVHMAPPAGRVPLLMHDLIHWLATSKDHPLISSSVFHYEFEFIHPFADGNGRMGRLWQTLILTKWNPLFAHIPVENLVHQHQQEYYAALNNSTQQGDSAVFIEFMLTMVQKAITASQTPQVAPQVTPQVRIPEVFADDMSHEGSRADKASVKMSEKIVVALRENGALTISEIAQRLGVTTRTIERNLKKLQEQGRLRRVGPDKGGHWEVLD